MPPQLATDVSPPSRPGNPRPDQEAELARLKAVYDDASARAEAFGDGADWTPVRAADKAYWDYFQSLGLGDNPTDDFLSPGDFNT